MSERQFVVIGGGPAGLTAAYELTKLNYRPIVLERREKVGGISCTETYKGFYFDMGGHRFFTKAEAAERVWREVLDDEFLRRPRLSRIYYNNKFFDYPLKLFNALLGVGVWQSVLIVLSFLKWQIFPYREEDTLEQWVTNRFGKRLFETFFKTYTEKVWGIPCSELKAEWAAQRIKDLSLKTAVLNMFVKPKNTIKTLIEEFDYPRLGPGMLWNAVRTEIERRNGTVALNSDVIRINRRGQYIDSVVVACNGSAEKVVSGTDFISSAPISEFIMKLDSVPEDVLLAAERLSYRDFLTVCLVVNKPYLFPDNWIYIHSPEVRLGRIQNFKNWSPHMVPDQSKTSLGLEYFCTEGDDLWNMLDADLVELGKSEVERIGLANASDVESGCVFRVPKAYPVYDSNYQKDLAVIKDFIDGLKNFQTIGRNGLHRYDNQDHAMLTGIIAARSMALGENGDVWSVNTDQEYLEEATDRKPTATETGEATESVAPGLFPRVDPIALGISVGSIAGLFMFLATIFLVIKDGPVVGPNLVLLSQYFPGYAVTVQGSLLGLVYTFIAGFVLGWMTAFLRNVGVFLSAVVIRREIEIHLLRNILDYM